jgi:hypothetical protein
VASGSRRSSTSSVIEIANTPSLKAVIRSVPSPWKNAWNWLLMLSRTRGAARL